MRAARLGVLMVFAWSAIMAFADVIDDAYRLCGAAKQTGMIAPCEVKGGSRTVELTIDTTSTEARKMCAAMVAMMAQHTRAFAGTWELQMFSPYGPRPIASCTLQ